MAIETGNNHTASNTDIRVKRRGLLRLGALVAAVTGASTASAFGVAGAQAAPNDKSTPNTYVPIAEKGAPSGVAALDANAKVSPAQLPDLSDTYVKVTEGPLSLTDPRVGANLNGSADCNPAFTTAFSLLPAGGGQIRIPSGLIALTDKIVPPANVTLVGSGRQSTIIKRQFAAGYTGTLVELANQWSGLRDLTVDGLASSTELVRVGNNRVILDTLNLQNAASDGLRFYALGGDNPTAHGNSISRVTISGCPGIGIHVQGYAYDNRFEDIVVSACGKGVVINDQHTRWVNLHVWGCKDDGVEVRGKNAQFIDAFLESNGGAGIEAYGVAGLQVIGGRLWRNGTYGASIDTAHRSRFIGVDMFDNQTYGLRGVNSRYVQVTGCQFADEITPKRQDRPISMSGTSDYWIIEGNVFQAADHAVGGNTIVGANNQIANNIGG